MCRCIVVICGDTSFCSAGAPASSLQTVRDLLEQEAC